MQKKLYSFILGVRKGHLLVLDVLVVLAAPILALVIRFDSTEGFALYFRIAFLWGCLSLFWILPIFWATGLYSRYWRYASVDEMTALAVGTAGAWVASVFVFFGIAYPLGFVPPGFPRSIPIVQGLIAMLGVGTIRLSLRVVFEFSNRLAADGKMKRVLIGGAGVAGSMIVKELKKNPQLGREPAGFVDDDPRKRGLSIHGVKVLGTLGDTARVLKEAKIEEVVVAMPTAPGHVLRQIMEICKSMKIPSKTIPGVFEIIGGTARVTAIRDIEIDDLLRRGLLKTDIDSVRDKLKGTRVLVTGAGGSIGSELCRQILLCEPAELVLLGHGENSLFRLAIELRRVKRQIDSTISLQVVVADIRDHDRMQEVFTVYRPQVIFHAAAHKHVGLMQDNATEAVTNNVLGTRTLVDLASLHGVQRFVMISSDKAVNPTSIMGVTKRVAELVVQDAAARTGGIFVTVRFGNVLGSNGSVVPIFKEQIALGEPVTVTSPEASRFFMTIPEAAQLVLQAGTMGTGGELFVLDMGEPVKIVELARDVIRLSGLQEGRDIEIVYTGLKDGEKLHEAIFYEFEKIERSAHEKILVCRNGQARANIQPARLNHDVSGLIAAAHDGDLGRVHSFLRRIVPEFRSNALQKSDGREANRKEKKDADLGLGQPFPGQVSSPACAPILDAARSTRGRKKS
jgi:FlaA1/EpsC-like NDP-sugar epimerase